MKKVTATTVSNIDGVHKEIAHTMELPSLRRRSECSILIPRYAFNLSSVYIFTTLARISARLF